MASAATEAPARKTVGPQLTRKLQDLGQELLGLQAEKSALDKREEALKSQIKEIAAKYDFPMERSHSQYLPLPGGQKVIRVTVSDPAPEIDPGRAMEAFGPELFLELFVIKKVDLDLDAWVRAKEEERVTDAQLSASLGEPPKPTVSVAIASPPKE